jgi:hypothetical protein
MSRYTRLSIVTTLALGSTICLLGCANDTPPVPVQHTAADGGAARPHAPIDPAANKDPGAGKAKGKGKALPRLDD